MHRRDADRGGWRPRWTSGGHTHSALDSLAKVGAEVIPSTRVVDDGDILTCGGVTAGIDLALWLVERELGAAAVERIAQQIEYPRSAGVHLGPNAAYRSVRGSGRSSGNDA